MLLIRGNGSEWVKHHGPDRVGGPRVGPAVLVDDPAVELEGPADEELGAVRPVEAMKSVDGRGAATEGSGQRGAVGGPVALGVDLVVDVAEEHLAERPQGCRQVAAEHEVDPTFSVALTAPEAVRADVVAAVAKGECLGAETNASVKATEGDVGGVAAEGEAVRATGHHLVNVGADSGRVCIEFGRKRVGAEAVIHSSFARV